MSDNKLVVVIMGQNCEKFLPMCLESVKDADKIIYIDGGSSDNSLSIVAKYCTRIINNPYNQLDPKMNGRQRNVYLQALKEENPNDWALCIDADEVVEDLQKVKDFIQVAQPGLYSPKMRHFIGNLGQEDATVPEHFVLNKLFKISEAGKYPEIEHPVLSPKDLDLKTGESPTIQEAFRGTTIWHLGYINGVFDIDKKFRNHMQKSTSHNPQFLYNWKLSHMLNGYPVRPVNPSEIPRVILDNFGIEKDAFYFAGREVTINNLLMVRDWVSFFNPVSVLDVGCGLGNYGFIFKNVYGISYRGVDLSKFATQVNLYGLSLVQGDIRTYSDANKYDLVLVVDILEHLDEKDLMKALENIKYLGTNYIFSIPFIGNPNLKGDITHKIHQSKEWWVDKLSSIFEIRDCPENWAFSSQILIGKRK